MHIDNVRAQAHDMISKFRDQLARPSAALEQRTSDGYRHAVVSRDRIMVIGEQRTILNDGLARANRELQAVRQHEGRQCDHTQRLSQGGTLDSQASTHQIVDRCATIDALTADRREGGVQLDRANARIARAERDTKSKRMSRNAHEIK